MIQSLLLGNSIELTGGYGFEVMKLDLPSAEVNYTWRDNIRTCGQEPVSKTLSNRGGTIGLKATGTSCDDLIGKLRVLFSQCKKDKNTLFYRPEGATNGITYHTRGQIVCDVPLEWIRWKRLTVWECQLKFQFLPLGTGDLTTLQSIGTKQLPHLWNIVGVQGDYDALCRLHIEEFTGYSAQYYCLGRRLRYHEDFNPIIDDSGTLGLPTVSSSYCYGLYAAYRDITASGTYEMARQPLSLSAHEGIYRVWARVKSSNPSTVQYRASVEDNASGERVYTSWVSSKKTATKWEIVDLGCIQIPARVAWTDPTPTGFNTTLSVWVKETVATDTVYIDVSVPVPWDGGFVYRDFGSNVIKCLTIDGLSTIPACYAGTDSTMSDASMTAARPLIMPVLAATTGNNLIPFTWTNGGAAGDDYVQRYATLKYQYRPRYELVR